MAAPQAWLSIPVKTITRFSDLDENQAVSNRQTEMTRC
jgi:hypothetical protein